MTKVLKFTGKLLGVSTEWLILFFVFFAFLVRTSPVQTYLAQRATTYFSKELKTNVSVDRVSIVFFNKLVLDGINIEDKQHKKIIYAKSIFVTLKGINQIKKEIRFKKVKIENGIFNLDIAKKTEEYNFQFLIDYFSSDTKTTSKPYSFKLEKLALKNLDIRYDDYRKENFYDEINYNHIHLNKLYLFADNFSYHKGTIKAAINQLSVKERCGLHIRSFSGYAKVNSNIISVNQLKFKTNRSEAYLPKFQMLFSTWDDFLQFDDKVYFNAVLNRSHVHMRDIQYFTSELRGMEQYCEVEAVVTERLKEMNIKNLRLKFGENSIVKGDLILPDFRELHNLQYNENISYCYFPISDIENFRFPKNTGIKPLEFETHLKRLGYFEGKNVQITGSNQHATITAQKINSKQGGVRLPKGLVIDYDRKNDDYLMSSVGEQANVYVDSLNLGGILQTKMLGKTTGVVSLKGMFDFDANIEVHEMKGKLSNLTFKNYNYASIHLENLSYSNNLMEGKLNVNDDNAQFDFQGKIELAEIEKYDFTSNITYAALDKLHLSNKTNTIVSGTLEMDISGRDLNSYEGEIKLDDIHYQELAKKVDVNYFNIKLHRTKKEDQLQINSSICDVDMHGNLELSTIFTEINNRLSGVLPALIKPRKSILTNNDWSYNIEVKNANEIIDLFAPQLTIAKGSRIKGDISKEEIVVKLKAPYFRVGDLDIKQLTSTSVIKNTTVETEINASKITYSDSIQLEDVSLKTEGSNNYLTSELDWKLPNNKESKIQWNTTCKSGNSFSFQLLPSYFHIEKNKWELAYESTLEVSPKLLQISNFLIKHGEESISLEGKMSDNPDDITQLEIHNLELINVSNLFQLSTKLKGKMNANTTLSTPFTDLKITGTSTVEQLFVNKEEVGDVNLSGYWENEFKSIFLKGDLAYRSNPTFNFSGRYFPLRDANNLNFNLDFNHTDIQFVNAFLDPQLISNLEGKIKGNIHVGGTISKPKLAGEVELINGRTKIEMFGVYLTAKGKILVDEEGFYINNMPIKDEEGNNGSIIATVYHKNFDSWTFDVNLNANEDITTIPGMILPIDHFLVMNTKFKEDDIFYGKGYATGIINMSGTPDDIAFNVDVETESGSVINFPMYGDEDIEEGKFIRFKQKNDTDKSKKPKIDYSGVTLDLKFKVTPDAKLKLIFNEKLGDEITAFGYGDINIKMDRSENVSMGGTYTIQNSNSNQSTYNFVLGPLKQNFTIQEGGTISWTKDPYLAELKLTTVSTVFTTLKDILPIDNSNAKSIQEVRCKLKLSETVMKPKIDFEIELGNAGTGVNEDSKAAIARINDSKEELNKQFFSLLLWKKFQPVLSSSNNVGSNAVADLVTNQINSLLNDLSKNYKINLSYNTATDKITNADNTSTTGTSTLKIGFSKTYGDFDITSAFGSNTNADKSLIISNFKIEYKLDSKGNIRLSTFNESNDINLFNQLNTYTTQGIGINYQEEFTSFDDFTSLQRFLNIFRSKNEKRVFIKHKKHRKQIPASALIQSKDSITVKK
jgi:hypothetical protein